MIRVETTCNYRSLISRKCLLIQVQPYSIAEKGKEDTEGHKIDELYEFSNNSTMIKCFEKSTVERIEENSNDVGVPLFYIFIRNTHNTAIAKEEQKVDEQDKNDIAQGWYIKQRDTSFEFSSILSTVDQFKTFNHG